MLMRGPSGMLSWLYRLLLCLAIVPMAAALLGFVSVFTGTLMGELAVATIVVVFLVDVYIQVARARRLDIVDETWATDLWDQDFDDD